MAVDPRYGGNEDVRIFQRDGYLCLENVMFISGGVSTSDYYTTAAEDTKFQKFYYQSSATSGDARGLYMRLNFSGAGTGGGEAGRFYSTVAAALTTGTVNGIHSTVEFPSGGSEAGSANAGRFTLTAAGTKTLTGTYACITADASLGANITADGQKVSFIRFADLSTVIMPYVFDFYGCTVGDTLCAIQSDTGAVGSVYGYARVICPSGAVGYIPIYSAHS